MLYNANIEKSIEKGKKGMEENNNNKPNNENPKIKKIKENIQAIMGMLVIIGIMVMACRSGSGTSQKSNQKYDYKTKSDGTRTWYEKDNPHIVDTDKYK
jgi:hypothetical protein